MYAQYSYCNATAYKYPFVKCTIYIISVKYISSWKIQSHAHLNQLPVQLLMIIENFQKNLIVHISNFP